MLAIEAKNLSRSFKSSQKEAGFVGGIKNLFFRKFVEKKAVNSVTFHVGTGKCVGLVGANGAGKTTLLKMCAGLLHPTSGSVRVLGYEPAKRDKEFLKSIGMVMGQKSQLWSDISPRDSLDLLAAIYEISKKDYDSRLEELTTLFHVKKLLGTQVRRLSLGERMKFELIAALLHKPKLLFLDEPTIGLDLIAKDAVREFISGRLKNEGVTIVLSSHDMEDIQEVCNDLIVVAKGEVKFTGTIEDFKTRDPKFKTSIMKIITEDE